MFVKKTAAIAAAVLLLLCSAVCWAADDAMVRELDKIVAGIPGAGDVMDNKTEGNLQYLLESSASPAEVGAYLDKALTDAGWASENKVQAPDAYIARMNRGDWECTATVGADEGRTSVVIQFNQRK